MRKHHVVAAALITVAFGLAAGFLLLTKDVSGQRRASRRRASQGRLNRSDKWLGRCLPQ